MSIGPHSTDAEELGARAMSGLTLGGRAAALTAVFLVAGLIGNTFDQALADSCLDEVHRIADKYRLDTDPPDATENLDAGDLADTGGLIEPPSTGDQAIIEPTPSDELFSMPTTPVRPAPARPTDEKSNELSASERALLGSMLIAARAEAERGNEADCFERLSEAQLLIHGQ